MRCVCDHSHRLKCKVGILCPNVMIGYVNYIRHTLGIVMIMPGPAKD